MQRELAHDSLSDSPRISSSTEMQNEHETLLSSCLHDRRKPLVDNDGCGREGEREGTVTVCVSVRESVAFTERGLVSITGGAMPPLTYTLFHHWWE